MPRENMKIKTTITGINTILKLRFVPEMIIMRKRGTREKIKCTTEDTTTETGKIDFGRYNLLIRLRF
jgi:hypothetical protein